jgi:hypothetical protein
MGMMNVKGVGYSKPREENNKEIRVLWLYFNTPS